MISSTLRSIKIIIDKLPILRNTVKKACPSVLRITDLTRTQNCTLGVFREEF